MGRLSEFHSAIFSVFMSTTVTVIWGHYNPYSLLLSIPSPSWPTLLAIIAHVGPPTYPAPTHVIRRTTDTYKRLLLYEEIDGMDIHCLRSSE